MLRTYCRSVPMPVRATIIIPPHPLLPMHSPLCIAVASSGGHPPVAAGLSRDGCIQRNLAGSRMLSWILALILGILAQAVTAAEIATDHWDYPPFSDVLITGNGFQAGEEVQLRLETLDEDGVTWTALPDDPLWPNPWTVTADADGNISDYWMVYTEEFLGVSFRLTATGSQSNETAVALFTDSAGSYTLKWYAADPDVNSGPFLPTYDKLEPFELACPAPSGGSGRASNPLPNAQAYKDPAVPSNLDAVTSLEPKELALCQIVPFFVEITVNGDITPENGIISFNPEWLAKTTSGQDFGFDPSYGVYCAFVDTSEPGTVDPGDDAKVDSYTDTTLDVGTNNERIRGTIQVSGLDSGDKVLVEIWVVLKCTVPPAVTGNVQTSIADANTGTAANPDKKINTGNQTVPLNQVGQFFTAEADVSVSKSADAVCEGDDLTYTIVVTNDSADTVANGIVVTDTLGANQTYVSSAGASSFQAGQVVTFDVGSLAPLESVILTIVVTPTASGSVENDVEVTAITDDPDTANNSDSTTTSVYSLPACDITLDSVLLAGQTATFKGSAGLASYAWSVSFNDGDPVDVEADLVGQVDILIPEDAISGTVYLTVTNENGCSKSCELELETIETNCITAIPPTCPGVDHELELEITPPDGSTIVWSIAPDDGPAVIEVDPEDETKATVSSATCAQYTVTVSVTQPGGTEISCEISGSFEDTSDPVLPELPEGGYLGCNPPPPTCNDTLEAEDECGAIPVTCSAGQVTNDGCLRSQTFTYSAEDACGNKASDTVTYTWKEDTVDPELPDLPDGGYLGCNPELPKCVDDLTAEDNCDGTIAVTCSAGEITGEGCAKSQIFTYSAEDGCGNKVSDTVTYTWTEDTEDPVLPTLPDGGYLGCNPEDLPECDDSLTATDNCGPLAVTCSAGEITGEGCAKSQVFTYSAEDACGNKASDTVTYTWTEDTSDPVLPTLPEGGYLGCNPDHPECDDGLTAEDNCGAIAVTCSAGEITGEGCAKSQVFTYSAEDACGNKVSDTVTYTWTEDTGDPVLPTLPEGGYLGCNPDLPQCDDSLTAEDTCGSVAVTCSAGEITGEGCEKSQTFTYSAEDACGNKASDTVTYTWTEDTADPVLPTLPDGGDLGCNPELPQCVEGLTAADVCEGDIDVVCTPGEITGEGCAKTQIFTYSAEDACGNKASDTVTYTWTEDEEDPDITCPPEAAVAFPGVPAPATTVEEFEELGGTASDTCSAVTISSTDSEPTGDCPRTFTRTYKATDDCGNEATCEQTITQYCPSLVTSSSLCTFDMDKECEDAFRLAYHQRGDSPGLYKITNTNPGQFYYNVFLTGNEGDPVDLSVTIPYPFVTHGAQPIHVYSDYTVTGSEEAGYCLVPGTGAAGFTIGTATGVDGIQNYSPSGAEIIVLGDYSLAAQTTTVTVNGGTMPASGTLVVTIHLDFGLKGTKEWTPVSGAAVGSGALTGVQLDPCEAYAFSFADVGLGLDDQQVVHSVNSFKKNPGFGASIVLNSDLGATPLKGVKFEAWNAAGTTKLGEGFTDADGSGMISYKHKAKPEDYWIKVPAYQKALKVTIKANGFGMGEFEVP
jgi:uncharacterized repeat protein (TIGR01451 family)